MGFKGPDHLAPDLGVLMCFRDEYNVRVKILSFSTEFHIKLLESVYLVYLLIKRNCIMPDQF